MCVFSPNFPSLFLYFLHLFQLFSTYCTYIIFEYYVEMIHEKPFITAHQLKEKLTSPAWYRYLSKLFLKWHNYSKFQLYFSILKKQNILFFFFTEKNLRQRSYNFDKNKNLYHFYKEQKLQNIPKINVLVLMKMSRRKLN